MKPRIRESEHMGSTAVSEDVEVVTPDAVSNEQSAKDAERAHRMDLDRRQQEDVARLADEALATPGAAGRDEFVAMAMQARILSMSAAAPDSIKGRPAVALHVVMLGRALGIDPAVAVEQIDIIGENGKERPSLSPELLNARIRLLGLGRIEKTEIDFKHCLATAFDANENPIGKPEEFTWEDAQIAGLADKRCLSGKEHWSSADSRCKCKYNWRTYPKRMLWWRAAGYCADDNFPEAGIGLYSPEELGAMVDENGHPIDASSVELPPGYEATKGTPGYVEPPKVLTDEELAQRWSLQERVYALPDDAKATFKERWKGMQRLRGHRLSELPADCLNLVASVLRGLEQQTKTQTKGEWDPDAALATVHEQEAAVFARLLCPFATSPPEPPEGEADTTPTTAGAGGTAAQEPIDASSSEQPTLITEPIDEQQLFAEAGDEQTRVTVALVKAMSVAKVGQLLAEHDQPLDGNDDTRRRRLVVALLAKTIAERSA